MKTKIHQLKLFDLPITQAELARFMAQNFELIKKNKALFKGIADPLALFHNKEVKYSAIQFGILDGRLAMTAYGKIEIKALKIWWQLYKKENAFKPKNSQIIEEKYQISFLPKQQTYQVANLLVSKDKYKELHQTKDKEALYKLLSAYIMANFLPFFTHIGYKHNRKKQEIIVNILHEKQHHLRFPVFNRASDLVGYEIRFSTNLALPHIYSIGQSTAMGYGRVVWL